MSNFKIRNFLLLSFAPLFSAATAFAEEAPEKAETIGDLAWYYLNFGLYVAILYFLLRKPIVQTWQTRRNAIEADVVRGKEDLKTASAALADAKKKIATLDAECQRENDSIRKSTEGEKALILEEAKRRAQAIARQTEESIVAEQRHAETSLRREIGQVVLEKATELLKRELTPEADKELRRSVASGIGKLAQ